MQKNPLGRTGLKLSRFGLGSMTWGNRTRAREAHRQIDMALAAGVNLIDTAEMYPANPVRSDTVGRTERIIGLWLEQNGQRSDIVLATSLTGAGSRSVRDGAPITPAAIRTGVEGALRRLKTDYIDLYQLHWPNRGSYHSRQNWGYAPRFTRAEVIQDMADCLSALEEEVRRGTVVHVGLANETTWGMAQWLRLAGQGGGPRPVTVQNEYSLLCRLFDTDMAELCQAEHVGLLAHSPLAGGLLTGKYQGRAVPEGSRMQRIADLGGRRTPGAFAAVDDYLDIAFKHDLDPVGMALAWCAQRPGVASVLLGASTEEQLDRILSQADLVLAGEVLADLEAAHRAHPMPF